MCSSDLKNLSILAIVLISIVFIPVVFILTGIRYLISDNKLYLKLWKFKIASLNIYEIYSIQRSYNPLSSPAASIKRLKISLIKDFALISPVDEKKFIEELISINPDIKINVSEKNVCIRFWDWDI